MRRVPRILLNAATVLSLVLCVATGVLWARSYWRSYRVTHQPPTGNTVSYGINWGRFHRLAYTYRMRTDANPVSFGSGNAVPSAGDDRWHFLGFRAGSYTMRNLSLPGPIYHYVSVPCWAVVVLLAVPPALVLRHRRRAARRAARQRDGRCVACGYDLRATPEGCPECGTIPAR